MAKNLPSSVTACAGSQICIPGDGTVDRLQPDTWREACGLGNCHNCPVIEIEPGNDDRNINFVEWCRTDKQGLYQCCGSLIP